MSNMLMLPSDYVGKTIRFTKTSGLLTHGVLTKITRIQLLRHQHGNYDNHGWVDFNFDEFKLLNKLVGQQIDDWEDLFINFNDLPFEVVE